MRDRLKSLALTHRLDLRQGETIRIQATDAVTVAGLQVMALDEQGKIVVPALISAD
jgi:hypothetical protein